MKRFWILAGLVGISAAAQAQSSPLDLQPANLSFRVNLAYPLDNATRDLTNTLIGVGIDYHFLTQFFKGSQTYLSIDWLGKSGSGAKGNMFPILINQKFYSNTGVDGKGRTYLFGGVGVVFLDITTAKTTIAGQAGFGYEFGPNIFSEFRFLISDSANNSKANQIGISVGYRF
ncbi:MAG TPA: outer membrane beta-barrel protein [Fimbriimonadaceae bacterium]|nr:outer membrane beta-barrel protein [Fimbriimonadaceae bacterium]HRJ32392.1 outer membrane beta-barrel protein [Fimbriimonadaceae bacterium]